MSNTDTIGDSKVDIVDNIARFDKSWRFLWVADGEANPVCRRLDKLIRNGNISKDQISYKYLDHMTQIYYDSKHPYDKDVINFFASVVPKVVKVCITLFVDRWILVTDKVLQTEFAWAWEGLELRLLGKKFLISFYYLQ